VTERVCDCKIIASVKNQILSETDLQEQVQVHRSQIQVHRSQVPIPVQVLVFGSQVQVEIEAFGSQAQIQVSQAQIHYRY
jgi:hypothetical protein